MLFVPNVNPCLKRVLALEGGGVSAIVYYYFAP